MVSNIANQHIATTSLQLGVNTKIAVQGFWTAILKKQTHKCKEFSL